MATESFTKDFTFITKDAHKIITALEGSKEINPDFKEQIKMVTDKDEIKSIFNKLVKP